MVTSNFDRGVKGFKNFADIARRCHPELVEGPSPVVIPQGTPPGVGNWYNSSTLNEDSYGMTGWGESWCNPE